MYDVDWKKPWGSGRKGLRREPESSVTTNVPLTSTSGLAAAYACIASMYGISHIVQNLGRLEESEQYFQMVLKIRPSDEKVINTSVYLYAYLSVCLCVGCLYVKRTSLVHLFSHVESIFKE